jgi:uncharacterized protein
MNKYTLITGASCGLGKEMAIECAMRGRNLLLTALPAEHIEKLGEELEKEYNVEVKTFEADLTNEKEIKELAATINEKYEVDTLINNAGLGGASSFMEALPEYLEMIILLNMFAPVILTRLLLPNLKNQGEAWILNISSLAAFSPMPYKTVYPASKAFLHSFSMGLDEELRGTGVSVTVAHPGGMKTNREVSLRIDSHSRWVVETTTLSARRVAKICINGMLKRRKRIIPGFFNKITWFLMTIVPNPIILPYLSNSFRKEIRIGHKQGQSVPVIPD